jgi:release factor glutamine methyltransferase
MLPDDAIAVRATTIGALRRAVAERLRTALAGGGRTGSPDLDARLLVAEAARLDPLTLPARDDMRADPEVVARAHAFAERRLAGEPVARILGRKEFWGLDFVLSPATLEPRPDSETLVEAALGFARGRGLARARILDLGTGSGAILLALLSELPQAIGVGTDLSAEAATTARANAVRLGLGSRARFVVGEWAAMIGGQFDIVVANPPYIPSGEIGGLDLEVRAHDPRSALDGGADGLDAFRAIIADVGRVLVPDSAVFLEIGVGQGESVAALAWAAGFTVRFVRDLAGIDRVAVLEAAG